MKPSTEKRLSRLYARQDGLCHWCDEPTIIWPGAAPIPPNAATVDHLRDRLNPTRWQPLQAGEAEDDRLVCACSKCNSERGAQSSKMADPIIREAVQKAGRDRFSKLCRMLYRRGEKNVHKAVRTWAMNVLYGSRKQQNINGSDVARRMEGDAPCMSSRD